MVKHTSKILRCSHRQIFEYVQPFFIIMHESVDIFKAGIADFFNSPSHNKLENIGESLQVIMTALFSFANQWRLNVNW